MEAKMEQSVADFKERGRQDKESGQNAHFEHKTSGKPAFR